MTARQLLHRAYLKLAIQFTRSFRTGKPWSTARMDDKLLRRSFRR